MSLTMLGKGASYEFRWRRWALLRDAVIAHLEHNRPGSRFPQFAAIGNALGVPSIKLAAATLATEIEAIRTQLASRTVDDLVISAATASVLYPNVKLDIPRALTKAELQQIAPFGDERTLDAYFSSMLDSMLHVSNHPESDGTIEVLDG